MIVSLASGRLNEKCQHYKNTGVAGGPRKGSVKEIILWYRLVIRDNLYSVFTGQGLATTIEKTKPAAIKLSRSVIRR